MKTLAVSSSGGSTAAVEPTLRAEYIAGERAPLVVIHPFMTPPVPQHRPTSFRATVHGTVFGERAEHLADLAVGDELILIPDPPGESEPAVWVHLRGGDPIGHLPPEISDWLAPWLLRGGSASAVAVKLGGSDTPSWKRVLIEITVNRPAWPSVGA